MLLSVYLLDAFAAAVRPGLGEPRSPDCEPALAVSPSAHLSLAWRGRLPTGAELGVWLENLLPENGNQGPFRARAARAMREAGEPGRASGVVPLLWGSVDSDYSGAVRFAREADGLPKELTEPMRFRVLDDLEIAARLREASLVAAGRSKGLPRQWPSRSVSLSGGRGKYGLTNTGSETSPVWSIGVGDALDTWIIKHEHREFFPGEAGFEAICQRTMGLLGVPAARTFSRVFDGVQAVLSERSDRCFDPDTGRVRRRHFEEFLSACGLESFDKTQDDLSTAALWDHAYGFLPDAECDKLTAFLAASVGIGHTDLHRRNLAFLHEPDGDVALAPVYDVSGSVGVPNVYFDLAIGIDGEREFDAVDAGHWRRLGAAVGMEAERMDAVVGRVMGDLPDALRTAARTARMEDENVLQADVDRRVAASLVFVRQQERRWRESARRGDIERA